jgi:hypothetical protein
MTNRKQTKTTSGKPSQAERIALARTARRRQTFFLLGAGVVALAALAVVLVVVLGGSPAAPSSPQAAASGRAISGPPGPEGVPLEVGTLLAPADTSAKGQTVNTIQCDASEQVAYHVHTHLTVYVNGVLRPLPAGIGIVSPVAQETAEGPFYGASRCYYWLHVHAQDGVIHIESPTVRRYTLGDFFAIWRQPLSSTRVGPVTGKLTVFVNGRRDQADPASILLGSHEDIQIDVGQPVVRPQTIDWAATGL